MDFSLEAGIFLAYTAALLLIYFFGRWLVIPLKWILRALGNSVLGAVVILLLNLAGGSFGIFVPLNIITALIIGFFGVPGAAGLITYFYISSL